MWPVKFPESWTGQWSGPLWQLWCRPEKNDHVENGMKIQKVKKKPKCLSWVKGACQDDIPFSSLQERESPSWWSLWHPKSFEAGWLSWFIHDVKKAWIRTTDFIYLTPPLGPSSLRGDLGVLVWLYPHRLRLSHTSSKPFCDLHRFPARILNHL